MLPASRVQLPPYPSPFDRRLLASRIWRSLQGWPRSRKGQGVAFFRSRVGNYALIALC
jgi:hypothetical protein